MRRSGRPASVLLVLVGVVVALAARPAARTTAAGGFDSRWRDANQSFAFNRRVTAEVAAGRLGRGAAADRIVDANPGDYLVGLHAGLGCPTVRESVARSLVYRAENPTGAVPAERPALRAEYLALFGCPYVPPDR